MTCKFIEMLDAKQAEGKLVCVGLDSFWGKLPPFLRETYATQQYQGILYFNIQIVESTKGLVCCYKPNLAFYLALGIAGIIALTETIRYIHEHTDIPVILDCKALDIGDTNVAYLVAFIDQFGADAITIHNYLGKGKAAEVFINRKDLGVIVLCKTTNEGSDEFQNRPTFLSYEELHELTESYPLPECFESEQWAYHVVSYDGKPGYLIPLYQLVALRVSRKWNEHGNCGLVVGATFPAELWAVRQIVGNKMYILGPGFGKQGAKPEKAIPVGVNDNGTGFIASTSSKTIFASEGPDFAEAAGRETLRFNEQTTRIRDAMRQEAKS